MAEQNLQFLAKLEQFTAATMQGLADKGMLNGDDDDRAEQVRHDGPRGNRQDAGRAATEAQANREATEFAKRELRELSAAQAGTERDAVIVDR